MQLNGSVFLDKREASRFDFLTVNETAFDPPVPGDDPENNINAPERLSLEATVINQNFSQQILKPGQRKVKQEYSTVSVPHVMFHLEKFVDKYKWSLVTSCRGAGGVDPESTWLIREVFIIRSGV